MPYQNNIFFNIPVSSVTSSIAFYEAIGFKQNKAFSDESGAMVSLPLTSSSNPHDSPIKIMLLAQPFFKSFLPETISMSTSKASTQHIICLSAESKEAVDNMVAKAKAAGGNTELRDEGKRQKSDVEVEMEKAGTYGKM
jgi:uncharacterized protein